MSRDALAAWPRRSAFLVLVVAAPLLPRIESNGFTYPAVSHFWVLLAFGALMLLPLLSLERHQRMLNLDLLALLSFLLALGFQGQGRAWPTFLLLPGFVYLFARMATAAMSGTTSHEVRGSGKSRRLAIPRSWLVTAIGVLIAVHTSWALQGRAVTDVGTAGVKGAQNITHGGALYGAERTTSGIDPHLDTYGPANYEAYVPFAAVASPHTAARLTTLFFDLLTAGLLLLLGRKMLSTTAGVVLAFAWLAFPFTLYEDALGFNDSIVAAALVGTMLAASAKQRGVLAAVAGWTKLTPLALVPLLASYRSDERERSWHSLLMFSAAFATASAVLFLPALTHSSINTFISRTFAFQSSRSPELSLWGALQGTYAYRASLIATLTPIVHGVVIALAGTFALVIARLRTTPGLMGLAAATAAVLIAVQFSLSYFSFSYLLWFSPFVLVVIVTGTRSRGY